MLAVDPNLSFNSPTFSQMCYLFKLEDVTVSNVVDTAQGFLVVWWKLIMPCKQEGDLGVKTLVVGLASQHRTVALPFL